MNIRGLDMLNLGALSTWRKALFLPAIVIVFIAGLAAEAKSPDRMSDLIKLSGLDNTFALMGARLKVSMKQALPNSPMEAAYREKVLAGLDPAAEVAFAPEKLNRDFLLAIDGKLSNADLDKIFAFLKSPLGRRMTALERENNTEDRQAQMAKMAGELLQRLKNDPERVKQFKLLDSSLRLTETAIDMALSMGRAVGIGMVAADERTAALSAEAIQSIDLALQQTRAAMTPKVKETILLAMAYTYRDASIQELRQYLVFLNSPAGKKMYGVWMPALNKVLTKAGGEFGHALMKELGKERT